MYLSSICYMRNYTNISVFNCSVRTETKEKLCHCGRYFLLFFFFVMISKCHKEGAWRNDNALDSIPKDWGPIFSGLILANIIFQLVTVGTYKLRYVIIHKKLVSCYRFSSWLSMVYMYLLVHWQFQCSYMIVY